ncbi:hypothetical protein B0H17DRAFT_1200498 [Mycena rosella]|uniref:F-box domain-containing protein n=1 Tax=Mycena rosella TaxID=1033263 RepID=A0AAD7GFH5_MYCRO|nr:hypothetical protein B0H17DRAFT_1200498 [Mycena rosella]
MSTQNYVDRVATEVWLNCWTFCDTASLRRLCRVCRYFLGLCQPLLFRSYRVIGPAVEAENWISTTQDLHYQAYRLTKLAASTHATSLRTWRWLGNPDLAHLTELFPHITNIGALEDTWLRLVRVFTTTLGAYQRLTLLYLQELNIDAEFRATLALLEHLEDLSLRHCELLAPSGDLLPLRQFYFSVYDTELSEPAAEELHLIGRDELRCLTLDGSRESDSFLAALVIHPLPRLVEFTISLTDDVFARFFTCLDACPLLASLTLHSPATPPQPPLPVVELAGHMYTCIPPVQTVNMRILAMSPTLDFSYPPVFDDLKVGHPAAALTTAMASVYSGHIVLPPLLEGLCFQQRGWPMRGAFLAEQHRAVLALERLSPALKQIRFDHHDKWIRTRNVWKCEKGSFLSAPRTTAKVISQVRNADGTTR